MFNTYSHFFFLNVNHTMFHVQTISKRHHHDLKEAAKSLGVLPISDLARPPKSWPCHPERSPFDFTESSADQLDCSIYCSNSYARTLAPEFNGDWNHWNHLEPLASSQGNQR